MKVKDLIKKLENARSNDAVVVEVSNENGDLSVYETETVDFGWSASGVVSIVVGDLIME